MLSRQTSLKWSSLSAVCRRIQTQSNEENDGQTQKLPTLKKTKPQPYTRVLTPNENVRNEKPPPYVCVAERTGGGGGDSSSSVTWSGASALTVGNGAHSALLQREAERSRNGGPPGILPVATPAGVAVAPAGGDAILISRNTTEGNNSNDSSSNNNNNNSIDKAVVSQAASPRPGVFQADGSGTAAAGTARGDSSSGGGGGGGGSGGGGGGDKPMRSARIAGVSGSAAAGPGAASKHEATALSGGKAEELRSPRPVQGAVAATATTKVGVGG